MEKFVEQELDRRSKPAGAYILSHVKTGKVYVGSSKDVAWRIASHRSLLKNGNHSNSEFQAAYNDDPNIKVMVHLTFDRDEAYDYEQEILDQYLGLGVLFNRHANARQVEVCANPSEETRRRISESGKGLTRSDETREKIRQAKLGVPRSQEMREFLRNRQLGKKASDDTRRKMSEARRGMKMPPRTAEHVENLRQAKIGSKHSAESIQAIRDNAPNRREAIVQGIKFKSVSEVSRYFGIDHKTARRRLDSVDFPDWQYL